MKKIPKQEYTPEFRELAVKRVKAGQSNGAVARELGLSQRVGRRKTEGSSDFVQVPYVIGNPIAVSPAPTFEAGKLRPATESPPRLA